MDALIQTVHGAEDVREVHIAGQSNTIAPLDLPSYRLYALRQRALGHASALSGTTSIYNLTRPEWQRLGLAKRLPVTHFVGIDMLSRLGPIFPGKIFYIISILRRTTRMPFGFTFHFALVK